MEYACMPCTHTTCTHKYTHLFMDIIYFKRRKNYSCMFQYLLNVTFFFFVFTWCVSFLQLYQFFYSRKLSPTWCLNPAEIYSLIILEVKSLKSRCRQGQLLLEAVGGVLAAGGWPRRFARKRIILLAASLHVASPSFSPLLFLIRTHVIRFGTHPTFRMIAS